MNPTISVILAVVSVQLVNGQDACTTAQVDLVTDTTCVEAFSTGNDVTLICMGTCRHLFDEIIDNCDASVSQIIDYLWSNLARSFLYGFIACSIQYIAKRS